MKTDKWVWEEDEGSDWRARHTRPSSLSRGGGAAVWKRGYSDSMQTPITVMIDPYDWVERDDPTEEWDIKAVGQEKERPYRALRGDFLALKSQSSFLSLTKKHPLRCCRYNLVSCHVINVLLFSLQNWPQVTDLIGCWLCWGILYYKAKSLCICSLCLLKSSRTA